MVNGSLWRQDARRSAFYQICNEHQDKSHYLKGYRS